MLIIALFNHVQDCFLKYQTRKQLNNISVLQQKDVGLHTNALNEEIAKANCIVLIKELVFDVPFFHNRKRY
ncbi:hypothetical protein [Marinomonas mediterranea]|uniref:hypothetical protein n=1 Tax=Marinomonas mediterranea TaxID=119864 RepID=UPI00234A9005|nr:hypothetical protein [Marinomonas mediterranea]WCN10307.1 hypothetical protein GV055_15980 [Marinomonas mediterranea]